MYWIVFHTIAGVFHQFDTIVYPRTKPSQTYISQFAGKLKSLLPGAESKSNEREHPQFTVPRCSQMLGMSLNIHLEPYKEVFLQGDFKEKHSILETASSIVDVFNLFISRCVFTTKRYQHRVVVPWQDDSVSKVRR